MPQTIDQAWLFIADDEEGEGLAAFYSAEHGWVPMVACDYARYLSLLPVAREVVERSGRPIRIVRFDKGEVVETLEPHARRAE